MKGLELSKRFYQFFGKEQLETQFSALDGRYAAGLAGQGSECYGYDDSISRDHDFSPEFIVWLEDELMEGYGAQLKKWYRELPSSFMGYRRVRSEAGNLRVGVISIGEYYSRFTGCRDGNPKTILQWLSIPDHLLSEAVNGEVFYDGAGRFSEIRAVLQKGWPEDLRLYKLSCALFTMAQAGQYNYPRCLRRGDKVAAFFALSTFTKATLKAAHYINNIYPPYYKWLHRHTLELPKLSETATDTERLLLMEPDAQPDAMEQICIRFVKELKQEGLTDIDEPFLVPQSVKVREHIQDKTIANLDVRVQ